MDQQQIRNFCIIAHIDHGKSTLADRILELTGAVEERQMREQVLDQMDLERERGITIKMAAVRLSYAASDGQTYELNLIDTPGHVDFTYEVSRSLAACEGAILVVDAAQGVEAQTLANVHLALDHNLEIIPVINKIDLPAADPERVAREIEETLAIDCSEALMASAKEGTGIDAILETVIERVPAPGGSERAPLRALVFDSHFDPYLGIIAHIRVFDGEVRKGTRIYMLASEYETEVSGVGAFAPEMRAAEALRGGQVGFVHAAIKSIGQCQVGDTMTLADRHADIPLPGYRPAKPMVFCGLYPVETDQFRELREALSRLQLNDAALSFEPESSAALGFGYRCGFLGLLHSEIIQERLEREFGIELVATSPSVVYRLNLKSGQIETMENPSAWPDRGDIDFVEEPYVLATLITPNEYVGACMELCEDRRGRFKHMELHGDGAGRFDLRPSAGRDPVGLLRYLEKPDAGATPPSTTNGSATAGASWSNWTSASTTKLWTHSALSRTGIEPSRGEKRWFRRLRKILPRQLFEIRLQAALGSKVIAAERISALRKDVTAKLYGGDVTRKRKLLERQKKGKKRMKSVGRVEIPQEAFLSVLKLGSE